MSDLGLSDAPSQVVQKFNTVAVDGSNGFSCNRDEQNACVSGAYLAVFLSAAASAAAPDV